jgi:hypothetical protein
MTRERTLLFLTSGFGDNLLALPLALELEEKTRLTCVAVKGPQADFFRRCLAGARIIDYDRALPNVVSILKAGFPAGVVWVYPIGACARGLRLLHLPAFYRLAIGFTSLVARNAWQAELGIDVCLLPDLAKRAWRNNLRLLPLLNLQTSRDWEDYTLQLKSRLTTAPRVAERLVIHAGSAHYAGSLERYKRWPLERFIHVAGMLLRDGRFKEVCWVVGPDDAELEAPLLRLGSPHRLVSYKEFGGSLLAMGEFLSSAGHLLTNDSGLAHLASLYDVPLTAISSGIGQPSYTGQNGRRSQVIIEPTDCYGCCVGVSEEEARKFECRRDWACMDPITAERVAKAVAEHSFVARIPNEVI